MAEAATPVQDDVYRRVSVAAEALVARDGVSGVILATTDGGLVIRNGEGLLPDTESTLTRLMAAVSVAGRMVGDGGTDAPVFVQDERNRIYACPLKFGLLLLVRCEQRLPAGLAYRLVAEPATLIGEALDDLFAVAGTAPNVPRPPVADDDVFWE